MLSSTRGIATQKLHVTSTRKSVRAAAVATDRSAGSVKQSVGARVDEFREDRDCARDSATDEFSSKAPQNNGDEELFANRSVRGRDGSLTGFGSFSKALEHDEFGLPVQQAFEGLVDAVETGLNTTDPVATREAFERIALGGVGGDKRRLANPIAMFSTQLIGNDSNGARMAPAPTFGSRNTAIDMVERYWMAICRDVPFNEYGSSKTEGGKLTIAACNDLNALGFHEEFGFKVTPETLFRGSYEGCAVGPHVSQYLLKDIKLGNQNISQVMKFPKEGLDYMTDLKGWLAVNNGSVNPSGTDTLTVNRRMTTMRDAGQWVHIDLPLQSGLYATVLLTGLLGSGVEASDAIPYGSLITTSDPFTTLGIPDVSAQAALAAGYALKHAWFQKWGVHRRLRPEVYAQRLELFRSGQIGKGGDPFKDGDFKRIFRDGVDVWEKTTVLDYIFEHNRKQNDEHGRQQGGTWLLPMGYPEGSPTHPAYPGGHSCFVAAAATVAKAFFKDKALPNPVMVNPNDPAGDLVDYTGKPLTVHGELNKLIANVTHFRDGAGMHWRSDGAPNKKPVVVDGHRLDTGGNLIGEALAVSMLRDVKTTYREEIGDFKFKSINGSSIVV